MQIKELLKEPKILPHVELESYGDELAHVCGKIVAFKEDWAAGKFRNVINYMKYLQICA